MYEIKISQYGMFEDVNVHSDLDSLLHELANVDVCGSSVHVEWIKENGKMLSDTKIKILMSWATTGTKPCLRASLKASGAI